MRTPRIKPHLRVLRHGLDRLVLTTDHVSFVLEGSVFVRLAEQLDGITPLDEIVRGLAPRVHAGDAYAAVALLEAEGHLADDGGHADVMARHATTAHGEVDESTCGGIVGDVQPIELWEGRPYVCVAEHRFPPDDERAGTGASGWRRSFGKGGSAVEARASAVGEAVERYSGVFRDGCPAIVAPRVVLGDRAIAAADLLQLSETQLAAAEREAGTGAADSVMLARCRDDQAIHWTPLRSLVNSGTRYVPTACCYYGAPPDAGVRPWRADSNGTAAAPTRDEAILQALLELVERDAVAIWWYNRLDRPRLDLATFPATAVESTLAALASIGRAVHALDLTHDLGIPVCAAVTTRATDGTDPVLGFGAHPDVDLAVAHALTEAVQGVALRICGSATLPALGVAGHPSLGVGTSDVRVRDDFGRWRPRIASEDLSEAVEAISRHGLDVLVLDQTLPEVGLPVARVVVPGLRHIWPRLAPGRLYSVPVTMGWLPKPLAEDQLNPVSLLV